jgi:hypothetical protein
MEKPLKQTGEGCSSFFLHGIMLCLAVFLNETAFVCSLV